MRLSSLISRFRKPLAIRRVSGHSMEPALSNGRVLIFSSLRTPQNKSVVLSSKGDMEIVKRLIQTSERLDLRGDNQFESLDIEDVSLDDIRASLVYPQR